MKKILIPVLLGLFCTPLCAETSLQDFVRDMGYSEAFIDEGIPEINGKKSDLDPVKPKRAERKPVHVSAKAELSDPEDLLYPRLYQKGESPAMIPMLIRLHKQNPASEKITRKLAATCLKNGQPKEALHWYIQTYQRDRSDLESLWNMASIAYRLGEMDQAQKYLKEYASVDPASAWGRMAREFIAGRFSGKSLNDGFAGGMGRIMTGEKSRTEEEKKAMARERVYLVSSGQAAGDGEGVMVVEGKRTTFEQFMNKYDTDDAAKTQKKSAALEGKKRVRSKKNVEGSKSSLQNARIIDKPLTAPAARIDTIASAPGAIAVATSTAGSTHTATAPPVVAPAN
jgi:tetratricopeptide (TPR) repeat protein